eukprot:TRINITY_DN10467_c0_g2_i2.p1 TRINITY_DN10467_c0_g2~~TRINITY_DN10467_c0_g2_i2.p1  ORF type:complete len:212 (+),score=23.83 TRINITY_DN10467_c0_g2_i2:580-1215(+)
MTSTDLRIGLPTASAADTGIATGGLRKCLKVSIGSLGFDTSGNLSLPGVFETSGFRVILQLGGRAPICWDKASIVTERQEVKYARHVSSDGRYSAKISCNFDEVLCLPLPETGIPEILSADIWFERRTVVETFDSILDSVGLGSNLPEFERIVVGRSKVSIPPEDVDSMPQAWSVQVENKSVDAPLPKELFVSMEWAELPARPVFHHAATL